MQNIKKGDVVAFQCYKAIKKGTIVVVDAHGTFFQQEERLMILR